MLDYSEYGICIHCGHDKLDHGFSSNCCLRWKCQCFRFQSREDKAKEENERKRQSGE